MENLEEKEEKLVNMLETTLANAIEEDVQVHLAQSSIKGVIVTPDSIRYPSPEVDFGLECTDKEMGDIFTKLVRDGYLEVRVEEGEVYLFLPCR